MEKTKVLVTLPKGSIRDTFFTNMVLNNLNNIYDYEFIWNEDNRQFSHEELKKSLIDKDACIVGWGCNKIDSSIFNNAEKLKFIGVLGGEVNPYIDEYFFDYGDRVIVNSANVMAKSVAEATIAYIMSAMRDIPYYDYVLKHEKGWRSETYYNEGLFNKTVGLIGLGQVGRYLIEYLRPFNVQFLVYDPYVDAKSIKYDNVKLTNINEVIGMSKIISIHAALTKDTYHMINKDILERIKDGSTLINTARGSIIDEEALVIELKKKRFKAVLDVYETEPLSDNSELRNLNNVILIPHMAGPTTDMRQYMTLELIDNMLVFFKGGEPKGKINRDKFKIMT